MPKGYEKIKKSLREQHPDWDADMIEKMAAMIWNKHMKGTGKTVGNGRR